MKIQHKQIALFSFVFLVSSLWMFSLTYNFNFFWEDSYILVSYQDTLQNPEEYTLPKLSFLFLKTVIAPEQFNYISYGWKPIQEKFIYPFLAGTVGGDILIYRFLKAFLFGLFMVLSFSFFYQLKDSFSLEPETALVKPSPFQNLLVPFLSCAYLLVLPSLWAMTLYLPDTLLLTMTFATFALFLFYFFYNDDAIKNRFILFLLTVLIVFFTELSILTKHVGRLNVLIIFFFLLFTNKKKIFTLRYGILLLVLFSLSFPILGFFDIFSGRPILEIVGLSTHLSIEEQAATGVFSLLLQFIATFPYAFLPQAFFLLLCFLFFFVLHVYTLFSHQKGEETRDTALFSSLSVFSFFWFLFTAISVFLARGFVFEPFFFTRFERGLFEVPQALFLISYSLFVYKKYYSSKRILYYLLILFLLLGIGQNLSRLNEWRGGWGAYFLGYDTVRQYIDEHEEKALLLLPMDHASPTYFVPPSTNEATMNINLTTSQYSTLFIVNRFPLTFADPSVINIENLTIIDTSPYGSFKKAIGRYYPTPMYLYQFNGSLENLT